MFRKFKRDGDTFVCSGTNHALVERADGEECYVIYFACEGSCADGTEISIGELSYPCLSALCVFGGKRSWQLNRSSRTWAPELWPHGLPVSVLRGDDILVPVFKNQLGSDRLHFTIREPGDLVLPQEQSAIRLRNGESHEVLKRLDYEEEYSRFVVQNISGRARVFRHPNEAHEERDAKWRFADGVMKQLQNDGVSRRDRNKLVRRYGHHVVRIAATMWQDFCRAKLRFSPELWKIIAIGIGQKFDGNLPMVHAALTSLIKREPTYLPTLGLPSVSRSGRHSSRGRELTDCLIDLSEIHSFRPTQSTVAPNPVVASRRKRD